MSGARPSCPRSPLLVALGAILLFARPAAAERPPWEAAFGGEPAAIAAAAAEVGDATPAAGVVVLLEETVVRFEGDGRRTYRHRIVSRLTAAGAIEGWGVSSSAWAQWYQDRPEVRARVIGSDGTEHWLDPSTLSEQPVPSIDETTFTDLRLLTAPLPGVRVGSVIEEEWTLRDSAPYFAAGTVERHMFGRHVPVEQERLVLDVPADLPFAFESKRIAAEPRREKEDGRVRWTWELAGLEAIEEQVLDAPGDVFTQPTVDFTTGRSWAEVGAAYARWVDERAEDPGLPEALTSKMAAAGDRRERISAALSWLHEEVRYTGLQLGDAAIVPSPPAEVLARQYGDCKDKATLLVAALRQAGIEAYVALLAVAPAPDVDPELPGLGLFDHAIVYVPGEPELWIDATADAARLGQLPAPVRGRLALIARREGAALLPIPTAIASEHLFRLVREVHLGDWGDGEVESRMEVTGDFELAFRMTLDDPGTAADLAAVQVEEPPATDLARPLVLRFPDEEAGSVTDLGWASVAFDLSLLTGPLDEVLPGGDGGRRFDLAIATPHVVELRMHVVPPKGFAPFDPPAALERRLGVARLERRVETTEDGRLEIELRLDSGPSRLTPEEAAETRKALDELLAEGPLELRFQSRGQALLDAGRIVEAVADLRRAVAEDGGAAHRVRLANALLAAGLGEAARREARAAVAADPEAAFAHRALGYVLVHDELGRPFKPGSDFVASESALRRARELDPKDELAVDNLAVLLEHDAEGARYAPGARLDEAIELYRELRNELANTTRDRNLLVALWRAGRYDEVAELAAKRTVREAPAYALAALAARQGAVAALREAGLMTDGDERREMLSSAVELLVLARRYPAAAELQAATAKGAPDAAARLAHAAALAALVPFESLDLAADDPRRAVLRFYRAFGGGEEAEIEALLEEAERLGGVPEAVVEEIRTSAAVLRRLIAGQGGNLAASLDAFASRFDLQVDGAPAVGYRVRLSVGGTRENWYLASDGGRPAVLTKDDASLAPFGRQALRLLDAGDVAGARQWLDWAREEAPAGTLDDPWSSYPIAAFWRRGDAADETACRRAARILLAEGREAAELVAELEDAFAAAETEDLRRGTEHALALAYERLERWDDLDSLARRRLAASPDAATAVRMRWRALVGSERFDVLAAFAEERLARRSDDAVALRIAYMAASARGDLEAARSALERAVAAPEHDPSDRNNLAWVRLVAGEVDEAVLAEAHRAVEGGGDYSTLHTLAALFAELGRPLDAKDVLVQALEVSPAAGLEGSDWYVLGRIAESFGETELAADAYRRVDKPEMAYDLPLSNWTLAQRRLAILGGSGGDTPPVQPAGGAASDLAGGTR